MKQLQTIIRTLCCLVVLVVAADGAYGQSKSRIIGTVTDAKTGEALVGANLLVVGTHLGSVTDPDGRFFIISVPVGTYKVQVSMMGYRKKIVTDIVVAADRVTTVDFALEAGEIEMNAVIVTAKRDVLRKDVANTQLEVDGEQITEAAGIQQINQYLTKMPGVSESNYGFLTIRGGSADQTGTMVNGISYNNAAVGNAETSIPLSAIEQVSVLSGGFNAEYGNFRSGLINVTTKSGSKDKYSGTFNLQRNFERQRRFGPALNDPKGPLLAPYLDPEVAFVGTEIGWANDDYRRQQSSTFAGWNWAAQDFNTRNPEMTPQATPLDYYLLASWMFATIPDYDGLAKQGFAVSDEHKRLFAQHARRNTDNDYNFDGGFGGPIPGLGGLGGTFYLSNNTTEQHYSIPVTIPSEKKTNTLLTIRTEPTPTTTLTLTGMWKVQDGLANVRPAMGDFPDASRDGGFMPVDNIRSVVRFSPSSEFGMYWFNTEFFARLKQVTLLGGITINHVLNKSTYMELGINYLDIRNQNPVHGDTRDTSLITYFGPFPVDEMPYGKWQFAPNHKIRGYQYPSYDGLPGVPFRFRSKEGDLYDNTHVGQWRLKYDIASQIDGVNYVKAGVEYNKIDIDHKFWEKWNNNAYNTYEFNYHRKPSQTGIYLQDQITYQWMTANLGVRFDYFYGGGGKWPSGDPFSIAAFTPQPYESDSALYAYLESGRSYIWDAWEAYDSAHPGFLQPIKSHFTFSPRIGVSFPLTVNSKFYFNYGHFRSNPPYYSMYLLRYRYTKNGLYDMPNPNLEPPKTIQYELGAAYNFAGPYILRTSLYYKDVTGQNGDITFKNAAGTLDYDSWENNNYEDIQGLELSLAKQDMSWLSGGVTFNYRLRKRGNTGEQLITNYPITDPSEQYYQGSESRSLPQPEVTTTLTFRTSEERSVASSAYDWLFGNWKLTLFGQWRAGSYFTWYPLTDPLVENNLQWPDYWMLDLKMNKTFSLMGVNATFAVEVNNLLNLKTNIMSGRWAFDPRNGDLDSYLASLHLPMYADPKFDALRASSAATHPEWYQPGDDKPGDLRSAEKPYINDPNFPYFIYNNQREVWVTMKIDF